MFTNLRELNMQMIIVICTRFQFPQRKDFTMRYMTYLEIVYGHLSARHCINLWYTGSDILRHPAMLHVVSVTF